MKGGRGDQDDRGGEAVEVSSEDEKQRWEEKEIEAQSGRRLKPLPYSVGPINV